MPVLLLTAVLSAIISLVIIRLKGTNWTVSRRSPLDLIWPSRSG